MRGRGREGSRVDAPEWKERAASWRSAGERMAVSDMVTCSTAAGQRASESRGERANRRRGEVRARGEVHSNSSQCSGSDTVCTVIYYHDLLGTGPIYRERAPSLSPPRRPPPEYLDSTQRRSAFTLTGLTAPSSLLQSIAQPSNAYTSPSSPAPPPAAPPSPAFSHPSTARTRSNNGLPTRSPAASCPRTPEAGRSSTGGTRRPFVRLDLSSFGSQVATGQKELMGVELGVQERRDQARDLHARHGSPPHRHLLPNPGLPLRASVSLLPPPPTHLPD